MANLTQVFSKVVTEVLKFKLKKYFNRIEFEVQNNAMYFDPKNPLSRSANANVSSAILASSVILSEEE